MAQVLSAIEKLTNRQKLILSGLFLSKYDLLGVKRLGFDNFVEAFNAIGYALGARPASVKNYRDEFDPLFPNPRMGWHKRPMRDYCREVYEEYKDLDLESFTGLIESLFGFDQNAWSEVATKESPEASVFAQRLITGCAAEKYFETIYAGLPEFDGYSAENTTRFGCGYDFRLYAKPSHPDFLAVEVKGLKEQTGAVSMTPKEYEVASSLGNRFYLFVVRNFRETPSHSIFQNPLARGLLFRKTERVLIQIAWVTSV
jgi:hypothetical protein